MRGRWQGLAKPTKMNHFMSLAEGWRNFRNSSAAQPADASAVFVVGGNLDISLSSALQLADQAGGDLIKVYEIDSLRIFSSCECCVALPLAEVETMTIVPMTDNPDRADLASMFRTDGKLFPKPGVSCAEQPASKPSKKKSQASCAEQPANEPSKKKSRRADGLTSIRSPVVLKSRAPLFDELLEVLVVRRALVEDFQTGALKKRLFNVLDARFEELLADRE